MIALLVRLQRAGSIDAGDAVLDELGVLAQRAPEDFVALWDERPADAFALTWSLRGVRRDDVFELFRRAAKHHGPDVRWAALEGLKAWTDQALVPLFVAALTDRADSVRGVAVEWLRDHGDARAIEPLQHLLGLPSTRAHAPGLVQAIEAALARIASR